MSDGNELESHYRHALSTLSTGSGLIPSVFLGQFAAIAEDLEIWTHRLRGYQE